MSDIVGEWVQIGYIKSMSSYFWRPKSPSILEDILGSQIMLAMNTSWAPHVQMAYA